MARRREIRYRPWSAVAGLRTFSRTGAFDVRSADPRIACARILSPNFDVRAYKQKRADTSLADQFAGSGHRSDARDHYRVARAEERTSGRAPHDQREKEAARDARRARQQQI